MRHIATVLFLCAVGVAGGPEFGYRQGDVHPDFRLPKVDGGFGKLSDYRGKRVVLFNFASW